MEKLPIHQPQPPVACCKFHDDVSSTTSTTTNTTTTGSSTTTTTCTTATTSQEEILQTATTSTSHSNTDQSVRPVDEHRSQLAPFDTGVFTYKKFRGIALPINPFGVVRKSSNSNSIQHHTIDKGHVPHHSEIDNLDEDTLQMAGTLHQVTLVSQVIGRRYRHQREMMQAKETKTQCSLLIFH